VTAELVEGARCAAGPEDTGRKLEGARFLTSLPEFAMGRTQDAVTGRAWPARIEGCPRSSGLDKGKASCQRPAVWNPHSILPVIGA